MKAKILKFWNKDLKKKGFIVPFAILISTIILAISSGVSAILMKEIFFSRLNRESSVAYYVADTALECAMSLDGSYVDPASGLGIFPYDLNSTDISETTGTIKRINDSRGTSFVTNRIYCESFPIFDGTVSNFTTSNFTRNLVSGGSESGITSTYNMRMDLGYTDIFGNEVFRCAKVTVNKTAQWRQIIARGYNNCDNSGNTTLERAVVNVTESTN